MAWEDIRVCPQTCHGNLLRGATQRRRDLYRLIFFAGGGLQAVLDALQQEMATCELRSYKQQNTKFRQRLPPTVTPTFFFGGGMWILLYMWLQVRRDATGRGLKACRYERKIVGRRQEEEERVGKRASVRVQQSGSMRPHSSAYVAASPAC